jgi:hypothetical protein
MIARASQHLPALKRVPVLRLLAIAEIMLLARDHIERLSPEERHRVVMLLRRGRGRPSNLSRRERDELAELIAKAEPRVFAGEAADRLSPVPLPKRITHGPQRRV